MEEYNFNNSPGQPQNEGGNFDYNQQNNRSGQACKFCPWCGTRLPMQADVCIQCGRLQTSPMESYQNSKRQPSKSSDDASGGLWGFVGFLMGLFGLILWAVWKQEMPLRAKSVLTGVIVSIILSVVSIIIYVVVFVVIFSSGFAYTWY